MRATHDQVVKNARLRVNVQLPKHVQHEWDRKKIKRKENVKHLLLRHILKMLVPAGRPKKIQTFCTNKHYLQLDVNGGRSVGQSTVGCC